MAYNVFSCIEIIRNTQTAKIAVRILLTLWENLITVAHSVSYLGWMYTPTQIIHFIMIAMGMCMV